MQPAITAIGIANPPFRQQQMIAADIIAEALQLSPVEKRLLRSVYKATKIEYRYSVMSDFCKRLGEYEFFPNDFESSYPSTAARMRLYQETALDLALSAVNDCFAEQGIPHDAITHLITVSCTGMYAPGLDIELVHSLNLNSNVKRTCINFMGCYGAFNAIKVADAICRAEPAAKVLIVSVELCTLHFQKTKTVDGTIANAIFSDGAAAVLVEANAANKKGFLLETFHCDLLPQHSNTMTWMIADSGFDIVLSSYVPDAIQAGIGEFVRRLLDKANINLAEIDLFAIHPGGYKILKAAEEALGLSAEHNRYSYEVLRQYGNMSSATVLFVLKQLWQDSLETGKRIFSCAFGPGLTLESMLLKTQG